MNNLPEPKLRDGNKLHKNEVFREGKFGDDVVKKIGARIVYLIYTGRNDLSGDDWADIFAASVGGQSFNSPIGIADVALNKCAWSMKTVKNSSPFSATAVRLISGRCSPDYSYGIENPRDDVQKTGNAVLAIYNSRVQISYVDYNPVRTCVLVRNPLLSEFVLFEHRLESCAIADYRWTENAKGNFEGIRKADDQHCFTWQPHGSQFTIVERVPDTAVKFRLRIPERLPLEVALQNMNFDDSWVSIIK